MKRLFLLPFLFSLIALPLAAQTSDISVKKSVMPDWEIPTGEEAIFQIVVHNDGPDAATGIVITDLLTANFQYVSYEATTGYYQPEWGDWYVGDLAVGQSETLTLTTIFVGTGPSVNCAFIKDVDQNDPDNSNDSDCVTVYPPDDDELVDIEVRKATDRDTADVGDPIIFTITAINHGPDVATGIELEDILSEVVSYASHSTTHGTWNPATGLWSIPSLNPAEEALLTIHTTLEARNYRVENCVELTHVDQEETDEYNNKACVCVNCDSTGGGDSGIESNGNMATALANRLFERRVHQAFLLDNGRAMTTQRFEGREAIVAESQRAENDTRLADFIPTDGPSNTTAYTTTPGDLIGITNATAVLAVDYLQNGDYRLAAIFGAASPGDALYDHSKATCDRLAGAELLDRSIVSVNGRPFVMQHLLHADGEMDYSISFVVYRSGERYSVDSQFTQDSYDVPGGNDEVLNYQVWSSSYAYTTSLVADMLDAISANGPVSFRHTSYSPPSLPGTYVRKGNYNDGQFSITLANPAGATGVTFNGFLSRVEDGSSEPFTMSFALNGNPTQTLYLPTGFTFDASIGLELDGNVADRVYFADAPWSYALDETGALITSFSTYAQEVPFANNVIGIERSAGISGQVQTWATMFRFVSPRMQPRDFSAAEYIEFDASGHGPVRLMLEKESITGWDQYAVEFAVEDHSTHRYYFNQFRLSNGQTGFTAEDVLLIAFYPMGIGIDNDPIEFDFTIENVRFGGGTVSNEDDGSTQVLSLDVPFPNPFMSQSTIGFALPSTEDVRMDVFDVLGRRVLTLVDGLLPAGRHSVDLDAAALASGTYVVRLQTGSETLTTRATVVR